jgi:hypothetical protein
MGVLIEGAWRDEELPEEVGRIGEFRRADSRFRDRITADGSSGLRAAAPAISAAPTAGSATASRRMGLSIPRWAGITSMSPTAAPGLIAR